MSRDWNKRRSHLWQREQLQRSCDGYKKYVHECLILFIRWSFTPLHLSVDWIWNKQNVVELMVVTSEIRFLYYSFRSQLSFWVLIFSQIILRGGSQLPGELLYVLQRGPHGKDLRTVSRQQPGQKWGLQSKNPRGSQVCQQPNEWA